MEGIRNLLSFLNENWTIILVCVGLIVSIVRKTMDYFSKSDEERVEIAKKQIREAMLKMIADAEADYAEFASAGSIKRSQVIEKIFADYPVLSKVVDQEELVKWIDEEIDNALIVLREIIEKNSNVRK